MGDAQIRGALRAAAEGCSSVLNVGCGRGNFVNDLVRLRRVGLDGYEPDLLRADVDERLHGLAQDILPTLKDSSFDLVVAIDFVEHLERHLAEDVIAEMKRLANVRVALFVPEGNHPQYGTAANPLQAHRSTWYDVDLVRLGFDVTVWPEFHHEPGKDSGAMWAVWNRR